jgi:hypothetical protein
MKGACLEVKGDAACGAGFGVVPPLRRCAWKTDGIGPEKRAPSDLINNGAKEATLGLGVVLPLRRCTRNGGIAGRAGNADEVAVAGWTVVAGGGTGIVGAEAKA